MQELVKMGKCGKEQDSGSLKRRGVEGAYLAYHTIISSALHP
jgi:hypothetical protein